MSSFSSFINDISDEQRQINAQTYIDDCISFRFERVGRMDVNFTQSFFDVAFSQARDELAKHHLVGRVFARVDKHLNGRWDVYEYASFHQKCNTASKQVYFTILPNKKLYSFYGSITQCYSNPYSIARDA